MINEISLDDFDYVLVTGIKIGFLDFNYEDYINEFNRYREDMKSYHKMSDIKYIDPKDTTELLGVMYIRDPYRAAMEEDRIEKELKLAGLDIGDFHIILPREEKIKFKDLGYEIRYMMYGMFIGFEPISEYDQLKTAKIININDSKILYLEFTE